MSYGLMKYQLQGHCQTFCCACVELKAIHVLWLELILKTQDRTFKEWRNKKTA